MLASDGWGMTRRVTGCSVEGRAVDMATSVWSAGLRVRTGRGACRQSAYFNRSAGGARRGARYFCRWAADASGGGVQETPGQQDPVGGAQGDDGVVEVVAAVVQGAWPQAVARRPVIARAVADPDVATGAGLQHEGEVFGPHGRPDLGVDLVGAHQLGQHLGAEGGRPGVVDGGRVFAMEIEVGLAAQRLGKRP